MPPAIRSNPAVPSNSRIGYAGLRANANGWPSATMRQCDIRAQQASCCDASVGHGVVPLFFAGCFRGLAV
jgi:hypothetical protein